MTINVHLTRVGNSRGIRIPRAILEEVNLEGELELIVKEGSLLIRKVVTNYVFSIKIRNYAIGN